MEPTSQQSSAEPARRELQNLSRIYDKLNAPKREAGERAKKQLNEDARNLFLSDMELAATLGLSMLKSHSSFSKSPIYCKSLLGGFEAIGMFSEHLHLNEEIQEEARNIFKTIWEMKLVKRMPQSAILAACIFKACRIKKHPKSLKEIATIGSIEKKDINKCYCLLSRHYKEVETQTQDEIILNYAETIAKNLEMPLLIEEPLKEMVKRASALSLSTGKHPMSVASALVYLLGTVHPDCERTVQAISLISGIGRVTVRTYVNSMIKLKFDLLRGLAADFSIRALASLH